MFGLPHATEFNKRIPKNKFYEKLSVNNALKRVFVERVKNIVWKNKIAESTVNIKAGEKVTEIQVFEIQLYEQEFDVLPVLRLIDSDIPYHIIFALEHNGLYQLWTAYKENSTKGESVFKIDSYFHTEWFRESEFKLDLKGLSLDDVYENFVRQIGGEILKTANNSKFENETLQETVERTKQIEELEKKIQILKSKLRKERQFNVQVKLNAELKELVTALKAVQ